MRSSTKGSMSGRTLLAMIIFLVVLAGLLGWAIQVRNEASKIEHGECKISIVTSNTYKAEGDKSIFRASFKPIPQVCTTIIFDDKEFDKIDKENVAGLIIEKMSTTWSAAGAGKYEDIWREAGFKIDSKLLGTKLCKPFYYFKTNDIFKNVKDKEITRDEYVFYLENLHNSNIPYNTLANYISASKGNSHVYVLADKFVDDVNYGIYETSDKNFNAVFIVEVKDTNKLTLKNMNDKMEEYHYGTDVCNFIIGKDNEKVPIT